MASTSNVYDADAIRPGREDDAVKPTAAYPASKLAAEALLRDSDLTWTILRLPFVYGDGDGHLEGLSEPLINPWAGRMDGSLARELGFKPSVPTIHAAPARESCDSLTRISIAASSRRATGGLVDQRHFACRPLRLSAAPSPR